MKGILILIIGMAIVAYNPDIGDALIGAIDSAISSLDNI